MSVMLSQPGNSQSEQHHKKQYDYNLHEARRKTQSFLSKKRNINFSTMEGCLNVYITGSLTQNIPLIFSTYTKRYKNKFLAGQKITKERWEKMKIEIIKAGFKNIFIHSVKLDKKNKTAIIITSSDRKNNRFVSKEHIKFELEEGLWKIKSDESKMLMREIIPYTKSTSKKND